MNTICQLPARHVPVTHKADVIVVGGGPGGLGAAVMAARAGAKTLLIERYGFLGGMAAAGEVHPFMPNHVNGICLDRPVHAEWVARMKTYLADDNPERLASTELLSHADRTISKDIAMLAAEDLCLAAGVTLLYHHTLADVLVKAGAIEALVLLSKSGFTAATGAVYVDCSGDADLAARAGCACEEGGPSGNAQPMTLCFKLKHVDTARVPDHATLNRLYHEAKARGEIDCPREDVLRFAWSEPDVVHFNTTRVVRKRATNGIEISAAEIEARRQMRQFLAFFRRHVPGFERAEIHSLAHHIGVRESRRVTGRAYLTRADFDRCAKFPDAIARVQYPIDIHNPDGAGTVHAQLPAGEWYEIPYGCIVAKDIANLLIGGRPISVDHAVHSSMRVMPPACSVGQAAGMAAAMAAQRGCAPADVPGVEVRAALKAAGAYL